MLKITDQISLDERELQERFVRASGPGGQNVNKVSTAVELRFDVGGSVSLPEGVRARLRRLARRPPLPPAGAHPPGRAGAPGRARPAGDRRAEAPRPHAAAARLQGAPPR